MKAVHLKAEGLLEESDIALAVRVLTLVEGVRDVALLRSKRVVSVLYDETRADLSQLITALRKAGVAARLYIPTNRYGLLGF